jgi:predicted DCC family thiol-disulfide oxidoreductase YuxK
MTEVERNAIEGRALLLYDGVCALCNGVVQFLMKHDRRDRFRYAPLESGLGREMLARFDIQTFPDGVMLLTDALTPTEHLYQRSDAVAGALQRTQRDVAAGWQGPEAAAAPFARLGLRHRCPLSLSVLRPLRYLPHTAARAAQQIARRVRITDVLYA